MCLACDSFPDLPGETIACVHCGRGIVRPSSVPTTPTRVYVSPDPAPRADAPETDPRGYLSRVLPGVLRALDAVEALEHHAAGPSLLGILQDRAGVDASREYLGAESADRDSAMDLRRRQDRQALGDLAPDRDWRPALAAFERLQRVHGEARMVLDFLQHHAPGGKSVESIDALSLRVGVAWASDGMRLALLREQAKHKPGPARVWCVNRGRRLLVEACRAWTESGGPERP